MGTDGLPEARAVDVAQEGDWVEYVDHMSGHAYYHNTKTKETRWDRPHGFGMTMAGATQEVLRNAMDKKKKLQELQSEQNNQAKLLAEKVEMHRAEKEKIQ